MLRQVRLKIYAAINGVRSGIPLCCIFHYLRTPAPCGENSDKKRGEEGRPVGYIQCDKCHYTGNDVVIKNNGYILDWLIKDAMRDNMIAFYDFLKSESPDEPVTITTFDDDGAFIQEQTFHSREEYLAWAKEEY